MIKGIHPCKIGIEHFPALHITAGLGGGGFTGGAATIIGAAAGTLCHHRAHIGKQRLCILCLHHAAGFCCRLAGQIRRAIHAATGDGRNATGKVQRCVCQLPLSKAQQCQLAGRRQHRQRRQPTGSALKILIQRNRRAEAKIQPHLVQPPGA